MGESDSFSVLLAESFFLTARHLEPDATAPCCRSQYAEEFRDSQGFGWQDESEHKFDWQMLVNKKVPVVYCIYRTLELALQPSCLPVRPERSIKVLCRPRKSHGSTRSTTNS